jgi:branched-chain amino acid transport system ATP-binding protein
MLAVQDVTVRFGGVLAVQGVGMLVPAGQIRGLIGPNGAGKTTFFNAISGLVQIASGSIVFNGWDLDAISVSNRARLGIRRTFQSIQLLPRRTVLENVLIGLHSAFAQGWLYRLTGRDGAGLTERQAQDRTCEALRWFGIEALALRPVDTLTFVQQRYVELARAVVADPKLLLLDEPAAGLSLPEVERLGAVIRRLRDERGTTIVIVEHVLSLVLGVSDVVTVFDKGRVIMEGPPAAVTAAPEVRGAYLGELDNAAAS